MRTKMVALFLILLVGNFMLAQTTPAPTPKPDASKAMCACCQGDKAMKAGEGCCKDCPKDMSCCKHDDKTAAHESCKDGKGCCDKDKCPMMKEGADQAKAGDKCPMMKEGADQAKAGDKCPMMKEGADQAKAGDKCPMMKEGADQAKAGDKCPMMKAEQGKKGCCAGDKCKAEKMHEHTGN
jgi:hypothetical protein